MSANSPPPFVPNDVVRFRGVPLTNPWVTRSLVLQRFRTFASTFNSKLDFFAVGHAGAYIPVTIVQVQYQSSDNGPMLNVHWGEKQGNGYRYLCTTSIPLSVTVDTLDERNTVESPSFRLCIRDPNADKVVHAFSQTDVYKRFLATYRNGLGMYLLSCANTSTHKIIAKLRINSDMNTVSCHAHEVPRVILQRETHKTKHKHKRHHVDEVNLSQLEVFSDICVTALEQTIQPVVATNGRMMSTFYVRDALTHEYIKQQMHSGKFQQLFYVCLGQVSALREPLSVSGAPAEWNTEVTDLLTPQANHITREQIRNQFESVYLYLGSTCNHIPIHYPLSFAIYLEWKQQPCDPCQMYLAGVGVHYARGDEPGIHDAMEEMKQSLGACFQSIIRCHPSIALRE